MALFESSGQTPQRRNEEATDIAKRIKCWMEEHPDWIDTLDNEAKIFVVDMTTRLKTFGSLKYINPRQLLFLRDLWERAL